MYRKTVQTTIQAVAPETIRFTPSTTAAPGAHPYEDPTISFGSAQSKQIIEDASRLLQEGKCVAFPTETVYGLGADATSSDAVQSIFAAKSRPLDNPLIVHIASLKQLRRLLPGPFTPAKLPLLSTPPLNEEIIPEVYLPLIEKFWPGPLTILLPMGPTCSLSSNVTAGQPTFAARMPQHPIALALAAVSGLPLAAPSANASGKPSPTIAAHVWTDLAGKLPLIIDGGSASVGLESTVVDGLRFPPVVLRPGGISIEELRSVGGVWAHTVVARRTDEDSAAAPRAPGMKYKHYSPRAGVVLYEVGAEPPSANQLTRSNNTRIGILRTRTWPEGFAARNLAAYIKEGGQVGEETEIIEESLGTDGKDIGRALFRALRWLDEKEVDVIHVEGIEETDEGLAVMNRLGKAASVVVRNVQ
ncbi:DHBP synthase RibB-like alpha/beta domain-containing protein [Geopyxis carbonaria]|nr:DHBP synthase RibB-like alpha/beta domain-containing protein [Geopyxis carbonaria]